MKREILKNLNISIVDVRTPEEFSESHYPGAALIPLSDVEKRIGEFKIMSTPIILYCRSGNRSGKVLEILKAHGIIDAINGGGLEDMLRYKLENSMDDMNYEDIF